jgi:hypothetical protein
MDDTTVLKHFDIMQGGKVFIEMSDRPNRSWGVR